MKKLVLFAVLASSCSPIISPCRADPIGPKPGELVTVQGFQISINADRDVFAVNTPVTINTFIKNVTDGNLVIGISGNPADYHISVKTKEGEVIPLTRFGRLVESARKTYFSRGPLDVAPGESQPYSFALNQFYDLTIPGDYEVKVSHFIRFAEEKGAVEATSNTLHFKVK